MSQVDKIRQDKVGYKRERTYIAVTFGDEAARKVQPCHVAHVKRERHLTRGIALNRIDPGRAQNECPPDLWPMVEEAVRHVHQDKLNAMI